jgi:solute carrier family 8 (sodium/calcium exchanger)
VVLFDPKGPTSDVAIHAYEDGSSAGDCKVVIVNDDAARTVNDKVAQLVLGAAAQYKIGTSSWGQQFGQACRVNGGDSDPDEPPTKFDYFVHYLLAPFKFAFAFVPPPSYGGGWWCFGVALVFIGLVTALIQDMAMLLGCALGLPDMVTAISVVAIGTSLPDTFASKAAAVNDDTADAAIGNVTGSNCVNVFLGLGLPWMLAAFKWQASGITAEWARRYGDALGNAGTDADVPNLGLRYPGAGFVVPAGDLGFSVAVFVACAFVCLGLLFYRRRTYGCELGGPKGTTAPAAYFLFGLWLVYVMLSSLKGTGNL